MKSIWKGDISFGLVTIPIELIPVESRKHLHFHLLDDRNHARIQYKKINSKNEKEVPQNHIVKGYEFEKDNHIIVDEKIFEKTSPTLYKSIDIEEFVSLDQIDNIYFDKPYYIIPHSKNQKAYVLLREALKKTNKVGVAKVIIRQKEYLSLIMPYKYALVLNLIRFDQEIRHETEIEVPKDSMKAYRISDKEMKIAMDLIQSLTAPWKPEKYKDDYQEVMTEWLNKKIKSITKTSRKKVVTLIPKKEEVIDFVDLLKKSMQSNKRNKH